MNKQDQIEQLSAIQYHIEHYQNKLMQEVPNSNDPYFYFRSISDWNRTKEIERKCLAYWKRRFNRISLKLMYNL